MATIKITDATGVDFDDFALPDPVAGTVKTHTATKWHIDTPGGSYDEIAGKGLTFDANSGHNDLTGGTITGLKVVEAKVTQFTVTGLSLQASDLTGAANGTAFLSQALANADTITGGAGADHLLGFAGNDLIDGGKGADTMAGGADDDTYVIDNALDQIVETSGIDTAKLGLSGVGPFADVENYLFTGKGAWTFTGNALDNTITGGTGKDALDGGKGNDTLIGGTGDDTLTGGEGNDTLDGGKGNDTLTGGVGNDTYIVDSLKDKVTENGGEGTADTIQTAITFTLAAEVENLLLTGKAAINGTGNSGANSITGNDGKNTLDGGGGADTLIGGNGNDVYTLTGGDDAVTEVGGEGIDTVQSKDNVDLTSAKLAAADIENIILLTGAISAKGNGLDNAILGNDAANLLDGGAGNDTLTGGKGDDTYILSAGTDKIVEASGAVGGIDTVKSDGTASLATFANVENLELTGSAKIDGTGNTLGNLITGNSGDNTLDGGAGNDTLQGGGGTDVLKGGAGNDTYLYDSKTITIDEGKSADKGDTVQSADFDLDLRAIGAGKIENATLLGKDDLDATGNAADNLLTGNAGDNRLDGGVGNDTLIGGEGNDTFIVDSAKDVVKEAVNEGHDTVLASSNISAVIENVEDFTFTGNGNWFVKANSLDNLITGGAGDDTIDAGVGEDTVVFKGKAEDFQIVYSEGKAFLVDLNIADGDEGADGLSNVEHVQFGDITIDLGRQATINGIAANDTAGRSVAGLGDINNDGFDDFIIGAPGSKAGVGAAYVIFGDADGLPASVELSSLNGVSGFKLSGAEGEAAGWSVSSAGDINKDGFADILVGAVEADANGKDSGAVYAVFGTDDGFSANIELGKLGGSNGFKISGAVTGDFAGGSVASAGDINGDGYDDIIIGADGHDTGGSNSGSAYVVFGHGGSFNNLDLSSMAIGVGFEMSGALAFDHAGWSVSSAGDMNGDGIDDLVVGAILAGSPGAYSGGAYVVFGHKGTFSYMSLANLNGTNGFALRGVTQYDYAGLSVSSAGDINGDGFSDVIVSAPYVDGVGKNSGTAYVVFGHAGSFASSLNLGSLNGTNGFRIDGLQAADYTGFSVSAAGDVNGDGLDDIIIGAPNAGSKYYGAAYVLFGKLDGFGAGIDLDNLDSSQGFWVYGDNPSDSAGIAVSAAGDIDGDGYDDLLVGAAFADPHGKSSGAVEVIYGVSNGSNPVRGTSVGEILTGTQGRDAIQGLDGDDTLNGLGGDDVLFGGKGNDILRGGAGNDTYFIDSAGDVVDEQGNKDTGDAIRTNQSVDLGTFAGGAIENAVLLGQAEYAKGNDAENVLKGTAGANTLTGLGGNDMLTGGGGNDAMDGGTGDDTAVYAGIASGYQLIAGIDGMSVIDINPGDGDDGIDHLSQVEHLKFSDQVIDLSPQAAVSGLAAGDKAGSSVAVLGDINKDGFDDFIVGAPNADANGADSGAAYVIFGSAEELPLTFDLTDLDGSNGFRIKGAAAGDLAGHSVQAAGDINGDGYADIIVGAPHADPNGADSGAAYVVFGKAGGFSASIDLSKLNGTDGFKLSGRAAGDLAGTAVHGTGDINHDGYADIIIGAPGADREGLDSGEAYVVYGHAGSFDANLDLSTVDGMNGFEFHGNGHFAQVGWSVSDAGDVNGDGFQDFMIGARGPTGFFNTTAFVIYGRPEMFSATWDLQTIPNLAHPFAGVGGLEIKGANGPDVEKFSGFSVSAAGDVNGDGVDDFVLSSPYAGGSGAGAAYVVFGDTSGARYGWYLNTLDGTNGFKISGGSKGDQAGWQVSDAGDVNGDGYADLIIGAPGTLNAGGSAYLMFGHSGSFQKNIDLSHLNASQGVWILAGAAGDAVGQTVSGAGDLNGDGFDDLLIGAPLADTQGPSSGAVGVIYGSADFGSSFASGGTAVAAVSAAATANLIADDDGSRARGDAQDSYSPGASQRAVEVSNHDTPPEGDGDPISGGPSADLIHVADRNFFHIAGGSGTDTLHLDFAGTIDFANIDANAATSDRGKISGIEIIDVANGQANALTFHLADILDLDVQNTNLGGKAALDNVLKIDGDAGDTLTLSKADGWGAPDTTTLGANGYAIYTVNLVRIAVDTDIGVTLV